MQELSVTLKQGEFAYLMRILGGQPVQDQQAATLYAKLMQAGAEYDKQRNADADEAAALREKLAELS